MKVLHVISAFDSGGAEVFVRELAINMSKLCQVKILAISECKNKEYEKKYCEILEQNNVEYEIIGKKSKSDRIRTLYSIRKYINIYKPDIINTHLEHITFHTINATLGKNYNIVQTIHNTKVNYPYLQRYYMNMFCKKYISISEKVTHILLNEININKNKIATILNGIDIGKFLYKDRIINKDIDKIVIIGRLVDQKNHKMFIKSYKKVVESCTKEKLNIPKVDIIGEGPLEDELKSLVKELELEQHIAFLGVKPNIDKTLRDYDLYVMSSAWEGLSISLIEALASGIPIIATDVGSNNEIINNGYNGILVESNNEHEMSNAIIKLNRDDKMRSYLSKNAITSVVKFNIEYTSKYYYDMYKQVIK